MLSSSHFSASLWFISCQSFRNDERDKSISGNIMDSLVTEIHANVSENVEVSMLIFNMYNMHNSLLYSQTKKKTVYIRI